MIYKIIDELTELNIRKNLLNSLKNITTKNVSSRQEFFVFYGFYLISMLIMYFIYQQTEIDAFIKQITHVNAYSFDPSKIKVPETDLYILLGMLVYYLILELYLFVVIVRRLHDANRSAWWFLLVYIGMTLDKGLPIFKSIIIIAMGSLKPDPKSRFKKTKQKE
jgi:uncharacterized membrane protein YhaH (DUF805 family)